MLIKNLKIFSFGKLKDLNIELGDGINIIKGNNEAGKSTIHSFIKSMLFGIDGKGRSIKTNNRIKYMPWGENEFGGSLVFENEKTAYNITRVFGKTKSKDKVAVINDVNGEEIVTPGEIGESLLKLSGDGFSNTLYISQKESSVSEEETLLARLSNFKETGDEDVSYLRVISFLDEVKRRFIHKKGTGGELSKNRERLSDAKKHFQELKEELSSLMQTEEMLKSAKNQLQELSKAAKERAKKAAELKKEDAARDYESAIGLTKEIEKLSLELSEFKTVTDGEISALKEKKKNAENNIALYKQYENLSDSEAEEITQKLSNNNKYSKLIFVMLLCALVLELFSLILLATLKNPIAFVSLGFLVLCIILLFNIKKELKENKEFKSSCAKYNVESAEEFINNKDKYKELKNELSETEKTLEEKTLEYQKSAFEKESLGIKLKEKNNTLSVVLKGRKLEEIKAESEKTDASPENAYLSDINGEEIIRLTNSVAEMSTKLKKLPIINEELIKTGEEVLTLEEEIAEAEKTIAAADLAQDVLKEAFNEIQNVFGKNLNEKVANILDALTDGKYNKVYINEKFDIKIFDNNGNEPKEIDYYSAGTLDLVYFAFRIAAAEIVFADMEKIPLFLDDAFIQMDDNRAKKCVDYLAGSNKFQVILFTYQNREADYLKNRCKLINIGGI